MRVDVRDIDSGIESANDLSPELAMYLVGTRVADHILARAPEHSLGIAQTW